MGPQRGPVGAGGGRHFNGHGDADAAQHAALARLLAALREAGIKPE
jgi:2C-methyl-D-erythritol 2,4-cyclodiphosphate synthase